MRGPRPALLSVDEFLRFESTSPLRHEYVAGRIYELSGTTARHNQIALNIHARLASAEDRSCRAYALDLKVRAAHDRIYYPDGVVVCVPHDGDTLLFDDPCLLVEVTSRSSGRTDHGEKADAYRAMPSVRGYLIAEHNRPLVTLHERLPSGEWTQHVATDGRVELPCPRMSISLEEIYAGVEFPPLRVSDDPFVDAEWGEELGTMRASE